MNAHVEKVLGEAGWYGRQEEMETKSSDVSGALVERGLKTKEDEEYQRILDGVYEGVIEGELDENYPGEDEEVEAETTYTQLRDSAYEYLTTVGGEDGPECVRHGRKYVEGVTECGGCWLEHERRKEMDEKMERKIEKPRDGGVGDG